MLCWCPADAASFRLLASPRPSPEPERDREHQSGTFLDVGCANGHLMEMLHRWLGGTGLDVEFYGLDISEGLLDLARKRLPQWHDRFMLGNALYWKPESKYDFVCVAGFGVVPAAKERELADHLFNDYVADGGRMIVGPQTEPKDSCKLESKLRSWGYAPSGYCEKSHSRPELCRRMLWFDKSG